MPKMGTQTHSRAVQTEPSPHADSRRMKLSTMWSVRPLGAEPGSHTSGLVGSPRFSSSNRASGWLLDGQTGEHTGLGTGQSRRRVSVGRPGTVLHGHLRNYIWGPVLAGPLELGQSCSTETAKPPHQRLVGEKEWVGVGLLEDTFPLDLRRQPHKWEV